VPGTSSRPDHAAGLGGPAAELGGPAPAGPGPADGLAGELTAAPPDGIAGDVSTPPPAPGEPAARAPLTVGPELAWAAFWLLNLAVMVVFPHWATIPFYLIWISLAVLYGFRVWPLPPTVWLLTAVTITTGAAVLSGVTRSMEPAGALSKVPLMAAMFWAMAWHTQRRLTADAERASVGEENARLLATQRRFLQDASHQLRTPITIALGHAELLARQLAGRAGERDINVVVSELNRLRRLSERLLLIAASENPDFLLEEPVALEQFAIEVLARWRPTAQRRWQLGQLDYVTVSADRERLGLAVDALLENAVRHTAASQGIRLSVVRDSPARSARLIVEDTGTGIAPAELARVFDRFATGAPQDGRRGTGLGLALVLAIARGHGGEVRARSTPGAGSRFEIVLPILTRALTDADSGAHPPAAARAGVIPGPPAVTTARSRGSSGSGRM